MTRGWMWIAGAALVCVLIWGMEQVVVAPLQTGDIYPAFSSLRSDPLGTRALYESLGEQPGIEVDRLYKERAEIPDPREAMLVLGVDPQQWQAMDVDDIVEYEKLVKHGGRLIVGFLPVRERSLPNVRPMEGVWNLKLRYYKDSGADSSAVPRESTLYFEAGPQWRQGDGFIERPFGAGTIVLVAQTFALSNEGLREARDAAFISGLIGPARRIVFDENHFGVVEAGSVAKLMRKYHLEGAVAVLAAVLLMFLWRSASSFLPPRRAAATDAIAGRDSLEGMTALLHRGVAERDLISVCFAEWRRTDRDKSRAGRVEDSIRGREQDPAAAYRAASAALSKNRHD
jgi:hypothetical protein